MLNNEIKNFLQTILDDQLALNDQGDAQYISQCTYLLHQLENERTSCDSCPTCGCSELLCGHNGQGCCVENDKKDEV